MINFQESIYDLAYKGAVDEVKTKVNENPDLITSKDKVGLLMKFYFFTCSLTVTSECIFIIIIVLYIRQFFTTALAVLI